ncbi:APC family permease [Pseudidiomarina terrestris]|uniref:APC family permease n=1 Tax=Pseudidiomarina terrestris TaxID=2820060 RepID=UPI002652CAA3|nr:MULTISPECIES: APC family permease [unclassified Pseudidiomarina]MDN7135926.1 amino acid permease [Pseudidiomarina sp. 1ASP75-5]MDN7138136.1 amino acid permease [Pseudidiomarina sp. 1ASP75-14]
MSDARLIRTTGLPGAIVLGLGSIVGTGAFVSLGFGYGLAGDGLLIAILLAAFVALCNGLSSAQLAAVHPVSGGTYEYGYKFLNHDLGFSAGWLFVCAKSASAAAAALASAWLLNHYLGWSEGAVIALAVGLLAAITALVLAGLRRSNQVNALMVLLAIASLLVFVVWSAQQPQEAMSMPVTGGGNSSWRDLLAAAALLFVAYTGYGRIATMGEEVQQPRRTIPRAIIATMIVVTLLYGAVGWAIVHLAPAGIGEDFILTQLIPAGQVHNVVFAGAIIAMLGVTLNLVLGVSRVILAMARRNDLPLRWAKLNVGNTSAPAATLVTAAIMMVIALFGGIKLAWTFSAFTVLIYYSITNLAALKVAPEQRFIARFWSVLGLIGCVSLALMVELTLIGVGVALLLVGLIWHRYRYQKLLER